MCQLESNSRKLLPKLVGANVIKKKRTEKKGGWFAVGAEGTVSVGCTQW